MAKPPPPRSTSRELERYAALFASRTRVMTSSAMRDMMAVTSRPEVISLAGGLPDTSTFPPETFAAVTARIAAESCARALQYGPTEGLGETKDCIAEVMAAEGMRADPEDVVVTTGGQQAIDLVCKTLIDPGDVIIAEGPTYPGAVPTFSTYQADVVQIEMDADGMRIDLMEEALDRLEREGRRPKFVYTVPSFQNPAGVTLSSARRRRLVEVAHERELLVLEDNPYGLLRYEGDAPPPLYSLDGGGLEQAPGSAGRAASGLGQAPGSAGRAASGYVMYLGTFSKILSPGIRLGWVVGPAPVIEKINMGKQAADLCTSTLSQLLVHALFEQGRWRDYVDLLTDVYRVRRDAMLDALADHFPPQAEWTRPGGGLFIWATLPDFIDTTDLLARALRENVAFVPGAGAYLDGRGHSSMRLNFSGSGEDDIREGIRRVGKVIEEQVALYGTLTGGTPAPERRAAEQPGARAEGARVVPMPRREPGERRTRNR